MAISFDRALGVHPQALQMRGQRAEVLAGNIANVDTPGFKAKELDFSQVLRQQKDAVQLSQTNSRHLSVTGEAGSQPEAKVLELDATQPSADGNTVDLGQEQAKWARNRMNYDTSFTFLNMKFKGLARAITGQ